MIKFCIRTLTAFLTLGIYLILVRLYRIDPEFGSAAKSKKYLCLVIPALVLGFFNGNMIMVIPTDLLLFASLTDGIMLQIYTLPCLISLAIGSVYSILMVGAKEYIIYMAVVTVGSFVFYAIKAINRGDVNLLIGIYPYLHILVKNGEPDKMIMIACGYFMLTCIMALIINLRGFLKGKKKFPFAIPALAAYSIMILMKGN